MRKRPGKWWQRIDTLWDSLCALWEQGTAWLIARLGTAQQRRRNRVVLALEELEPRWVPNSAPVAVNDSYSVHFGTTLNVIATVVLPEMSVSFRT